MECVRDTEGSLFVLGDKDLLYRAVYNILVNAYQAIGTNGTSISAANDGTTA